MAGALTMLSQQAMVRTREPAVMETVAASTEAEAVETEVAVIDAF